MRSSARSRRGRPADGPVSHPARPVGDDPCRAPPYALGVPGLDLRLRAGSAELFNLPWLDRLAEWDATAVAFRDIPVGLSRHLVRFVEADGRLWALKELPRRTAVERVRGAARARAPVTGRRPGRGAGHPALRGHGHPRHPLPGALLAVPAPAAAGPVHQHRASRPPLRRRRWAARRSPPQRRVLGRLLAQQHAVHAGWSGDPGLAGRRRDGGAPHTLERWTAPAGPRDHGRERARGTARRRRPAGGTRGHRGSTRGRGRGGRLAATSTCGPCCTRSPSSA